MRAGRGRLVAFCALAGLSLAGVGHLAWATARAAFGSSAPPVRIDDRYLGVLASLPADAVIGYVSDLPRDLGDGDYRFYERYYQAQYAAAPRLLIDSAAQQIVLADLSDPQAAPTIAKRYGLRVIGATPSGHVVLMAPGLEGGAR
jgi:hypothetical protein